MCARAKVAKCEMPGLVQRATDVPIERVRTWTHDNKNGPLVKDTCEYMP